MNLLEPNIAEFRDPGDPTDTPKEDDLNQLTRALEKYAPHDERFDLTKDGVHVVRSSQTTTERTFFLSQPSLCIVPQGAKSVRFGHSGFEYDHSKMVVYAAEIPLHVKITRATKAHPYYCLIIPIDPHRLSELITKVFPHGLGGTEDTRAVYVGESHPKIVKSAVRMMELIEQQEDVDLLVPLVIDEIMIRLLRSPAGAAIAQIGIHDSNTYKLAKAISWLKDNYTKPVRIEDLAKISGMSVSVFHSRFKSMTDMTPLQFQKTLRLQQARNLIRINMMDISRAAFAVGYVSPSQFSREYSRFFDISPVKDKI